MSGLRSDVIALSDLSERDLCAWTHLPGGAISPTRGRRLLKQAFSSRHSREYRRKLKGLEREVGELTLHDQSHQDEAYDWRSPASISFHASGL
jgi:hypothetical protein